MTQRTHTIVTTAVITGFITACLFFWLGVYACNNSIKAYYEQQLEQRSDHR